MNKIINVCMVNTILRTIYPQNNYIGVEGENEITKLVFKFDDFQDGEARLETMNEDTTHYLVMQKDIENEQYYVLITNSMLADKTSIDLQLRIVGQDNTVFKSKIFTLQVLEGINATQEIPIEQPEWVDYVDEELLRLEEEKVDKVEGKQLSTNDFTDTYKNNVDENTIAKHTHSNKTLLDTYNQTNENILDAVSKKHNHNNKAILDNITASFTTQEKEKLESLENYNDTEIKSDINNLENNKANRTEIPTKTSDITNNSGYIDNTVDDLINYELKTNTGNSIDLSIDPLTYIMTLQLKNSAGSILSTANIDLPLESMIVNASYSNGILTLTLQNGQTLDIDISSIVSGLVSEETFNTTIATINGSLSNKVDKITGKSLIEDAKITKLDGIEEGAKVNTVDDVQVDGVSVVENKVANIDLSGKMDKNNAVGTGSFSLNRRGKQGVGRNSATLGEGCDAGGEGAISMGYYNKVLGSRSAAIGRDCDANNGSCYVIGRDLVTNSPDQTIIGNFNGEASSDSVVLADGTGTNDRHNAVEITRSNGTTNINMNGNVSANNTMNIAQGLTVAGNEVVNGKLNVSGISSFTNTATFNSTLNAKYSGTTYNVGAKLAELSNLKEAKFSSKLMWNNNTVELKPGMVFLFPSDCNATVTIVGRKGLKTNPVQTYTITVQDLCAGICTEAGEADEDGKDSNYWRMFIGYRTGTLSFDSDTYYISKSNTVTVTCNVAGGRWAYFISK